MIIIFVWLFLVTGIQSYRCSATYINKLQIICKANSSFPLFKLLMRGWLVDALNITYQLTPFENQIRMQYECEKQHQYLLFTNDKIIPLDVRGFENQTFVVNSHYKQLLERDIQVLNHSAAIYDINQDYIKQLKLKLKLKTITQTTIFSINETGLSLGPGFLRISEGLLTYYQNGYAYDLNHTCYKIGSVFGRSLWQGYCRDNQLIFQGISIMQQKPKEINGSVGVALSLSQQSQMKRLREHTIKFKIRNLYLLEKDEISFFNLVKYALFIPDININLIFTSQHDWIADMYLKSHQIFITKELEAGFSINYINSRFTVTKAQYGRQVNTMPFSNALFIKIHDMLDSTQCINCLKIGQGQISDNLIVMQSLQYFPNYVYIKINIETGFKIKEYQTTIRRSMTWREILLKVFCNRQNLFDWILYLIILGQVAIIGSQVAWRVKQQLKIRDYQIIKQQQV